MRNKGLTGILCAALCAAITATASASLKDDLSAAEIKQIESGEMVTHQKEVDGGIWPELTVYRLVKAPAKEVTSVLGDYPNAHTYIPNLIKAEVVDTPATNVKDVEYTVKLPLFSTMQYTVRNKFEAEGDTLFVKWNLLQSPLADESTGSLAVEPFGEYSIIRYKNYVKPKTKLAGVAKGAALKEVQETVLAISKEAERRSGEG